jgi:hypothetical protein
VKNVLRKNKKKEKKEEPTLAIEGKRMRNATKRSKETCLERESMAVSLWLGLEAKESGRDRTRWGLILEVGELNTVGKPSIETRERKRGKGGCCWGFWVWAMEVEARKSGL